MVDRPTLNQAVSGTKNKPSAYNQNFEKMMKYCEDSIDEMKTWTTNIVDLPITPLATLGTINLSDNSINRISPTGEVTFTLPSVTDNTKFHQILVQMYLASEQTINLGTTNYFYKIEPTFSTGSYDIIYEYDGSNWVVGAMSKGTV